MNENEGINCYSREREIENNCCGKQTRFRIS
jgi:hypothetical protein